MRRLLTILAAVALLVAGGIQWVRADISSVTPAMTLIAAPSSVTLNSLESNNDIFVFEEKQGVTVGVSLGVDFTSPGTYKKPADLLPASLVPGLTVCSHLIHFDPVGTGLASSEGAVTFANDVVGVMTSDANLDASDAVVGNPGTTYPTGLTARGLELSPSSEVISLSPDKRTIRLSVRASTAVDQARVLTRCPQAPEPRPEWVYSVKYTCGVVREIALERTTLAPGMYATDVNISNPASQDTELSKRLIPIVGEGFPTARQPKVQTHTVVDFIGLPARNATMDDCFRIADLLYGGVPFPTLDTMPLSVGFLEIRSPVELDVVAVYTTATDTATGVPPGTPTVDVEQIEGRQVK